MRSETLRTFKLGFLESAAVITSACSASIASQVTSITTRSKTDSTTSNAVIAAPAADITWVISETGWPEAGPSTRIVIP